jgi:hypothetical protein
MLVDYHLFTRSISYVFKIPNEVGIHIELFKGQLACLRFALKYYSQQSLDIETQMAQY